MFNDQFTREKAEDWIQKGLADLVAFGTPFISNPDLPWRFKAGRTLTPPDATSFYGGTEKGYTDYPFLQEASHA
jgi:N-ethylmaleimide reductase